MGGIALLAHSPKSIGVVKYLDRYIQSQTKHRFCEKSLVSNELSRLRY